jgi:hypothetical protein
LEFAASSDRCSAKTEDAPVPIALHRAALDRYIETVNSLAETMAGHAKAEDDRGPLIDDFRALVHSVIIHPKGPGQGFEVEVKGKLRWSLEGPSRGPI